MPGKPPLVTVVTPSYNQAEYLEQTIHSVLGQEYPNLEYLIVDGGSTDGSLEVIQRYADRLAWWVSEPDKGQADAINKGFARATGKYVAWLNSDDLYLPGTVQKAVETLEQHPDVGLVYGNLLSINARGEHVHTIRYRPFALEDLLAFFIIGQPTVFMRRSILDQVGYLSEDYDYLLDHHLWLRFAAVSGLKYIPQPWAAARYHPSAKNMAMAEHFGAEAFRILEWARTQPKMAAIIERSEERILGGLHRFNAHYLLDAAQPMRALRAYRDVWKYYPEFALRRLNRIVFSFMSIAGLGGLRRLIYRRYLIPPPPKDAEEQAEPFARRVSQVTLPGKKPRPRDTLPPILVTGAHRTSTTWVGKMLTANQQYVYVSEPLNIHHRRGVMRTPVKHWYSYVTDDNQDQVLSSFYETMALRYHTWLELTDLRSLKDAGRMMRDWSAFTFGRNAGKQVMLKDPFAVFSAVWFSRRLGCEVVIAVRHPAAFVSSLKRLNWPFQFEDLLAQPLLMRDWLEPYREEMIRAQEEPVDIIHQASLLWRIIYQVVHQSSIQHPEFHVVRHEDLSLQPLEEFMALYRALGIPFTKRVVDRIRKSTNPGNPTELPLESIHSVNLDSRTNLKNWQKRLSVKEIDQVRELTEDVSRLYYNDEDWA
ncbi:MAG TPA: glycosyltransferase [Anaerolineales bacterium]|nr:glycosyltransferase [Anaerolineales bacterium]